jgi:hypothetical protein
MSRESAALVERGVHRDLNWRIAEVGRGGHDVGAAGGRLILLRSCVFW